MAKIKVYNGTEVEQAVQENGGLLFIHFASSLASSCDLVHRELETVLPEFEQWVEFAEVEVSLSDMELIQAHRLEQIPTLLVFDRTAEVERLETLLGVEGVQQFLRDTVSYYSPAAGPDPQPPHEAPRDG